MTDKEKAALAITKRSELVSLDEKHADAELIPEQTWIYDWKDGECQRVRLKVNGAFTDPVAWLTTKVEEEKAKP